MQVPILSGVYVGQQADIRTSYPRNLVPVPKTSGVSDGFLRPADGIEAFATGQGVDRGAIQWNGVCYRVNGTKLIRVASDGVVTVLGDVGGSGAVTLDYGFDRLSITSGGSLWYWSGTALTQVTDHDLGYVIDHRWIAGYYLCTDGTSLVVTDLNDPTAVNPLKYGSAEADPDPIKAVDELSNEAYALGRYTIEVFQNVGGSGFPFKRVEGAMVPRGVIGTHAYTQVLKTFAFLGSGRNEAPAVYLMLPGDSTKISTAEIDIILSGYTEEQLSACVMETRIDRGHSHVMLHLPDRCLVYDVAASKVVGVPVWFTLDSGIASPATYRARNLVWCYDRWIVGDPTSSSIGRMTDTTGKHFGATVGWEFGTLMLFNEGRDGLVNSLELIGTPGRVPVGAAPVVWASYSLDGQTWSMERSVAAGKAGQTGKRLQWRRQGRIGLYRIQRFRGTSDCRMSFARLEAELEPLNG